MSILGNILWFIFGGVFSGLSWILSGIIWCITIVGIPYGYSVLSLHQCHLHHLEQELFNKLYN